MFSGWAAVTRDRDYIRMEGLKRVVNDAKHRKELVVGGLDEFLTEGMRDGFRWRVRTNVIHRIL